MSARFKIIAVTVVGTVGSFLLGPVLWPNAPGFALTGLQLPLLITIGALESLAFGLGLAFILYGWPIVRNIAAPSRKSAQVLFISIAWQLLSWWPHDRMHASNLEGDMWRLIRIEYIFHLTLVVSAIAMAACFFEILKHHPKMAK